MACDACGGVSQAQSDALRLQIDVAVQKKSQDALKQQAAGVLELLQSAAQLGKAAGKGNSFDAVG